MSSSLNQSQQNTSPCFGQSANHGVCRPYALAAAGGYHLRRPMLTLWPTPSGCLHDLCLSILSSIGLGVAGLPFKIIYQVVNAHSVMHASDTPQPHGSHANNSIPPKSQIPVTGNKEREIRHDPFFLYSSFLVRQKTKNETRTVFRFS